MTQNSNLKAYHYNLVIMAEDQRQADRVVTERTGYDEDLRECGVGDYQISASTTDGRELDPVEPGEDAAEPVDVPAVPSIWDTAAADLGQLHNMARVNAVMGGGPEKMIWREKSATAAALLELIYRSSSDETIRLRLDGEGSLFSMDLLHEGEWIEMKDGPLHALVIAAMSGGKSAPVPAVNSNWTLSGATADQRYSFARINTILGGGPLPSARAAGDSKEPLLELTYPHDGEEPVRIRLDADGSMRSMQTTSGTDWIDMDGGPLHALVVDALNVTVVG